MPNTTPCTHRRFHSPHGGDPGVGGGPVSLYYNPKPLTAAKKEVLQRAAARLYSRDTLKAHGLGMVADTANLAKAGIHYYYRDKDTLVADLLVSHVLAISDRVAAAFDSTAEVTPHERMTTLIGAFLESVHTDPDAHATLRLNSTHLSEQRRSSLASCYRPILGTLREALEAGVPGLDAHPEMTRLLIRLAVGAISESVHWFREGGPLGREELAVLLAAQLLLAARATAEGVWPEPEPLPKREVKAPPEQSHAASPALPRPTGEEVWITCESALNNWGKVRDAALAGTEVVLTHRGWPILQLVPAVAKQQLMRVVSGRTGTRGRKARQTPAEARTSLRSRFEPEGE
jgi:AcrR family transcriptional regulator/antitoxin (DNA-binding transcriptional repressor) of toxin-antitoxin stability system